MGLCRRSGWRLWLVTAVCAFVLHMTGASTGPAAPSPAPPGSLASCLNAVADPTGQEISCDYNALLTDAERSDMRRISRGLLQDAHCLVKVRIARDLLDPALTAASHQFDAPPQPVHCQIITKNGGFAIDATFAPKVTFKDDRAVDATPGLANVTGVNSYLAWPVVAYVNTAAGIRKAMIDMINTYRATLRQRKAANR